MRKVPRASLQSLDIFSGAGGLALGLAKAGFSHLAVIDLDHIACETIRLNKPKEVDNGQVWNVVETDLTDFSLSEYSGKIDLLGGGPPCQPFSQAGNHEGRKDARDMFPAFVRAVREVRPKAFIVENVKGILRRNFRAYLDYVVLQLGFPLVERKHREKWTEHRARLEKLYTGGKYNGLHYKVILQSLNAANFGVPQWRERLFIVGVQADAGIEYSFPLATHTKKQLLIDQWVTGAYWNRHGIAKKRRPAMPEQVSSLLSDLREEDQSGQPWRTVRDAISDLPAPKVKEGQVNGHYLIGGARSYFGHNGSSFDMPAKTLKAGHHGVPGGENMIRLDNGAVRYFSIRECARLQTFPDKWAFHGPWTRCMQQIGNAVPVDLAEVVALPLAIALTSSDRAGSREDGH
jgi:DNA (cytosine-5)-methyltransferase 1